MGHLRDMNDKQLSEFMTMKYNANKEARRGHSYQYPNHEQQIKLSELGYIHHVFGNKTDTYSETEAQKVVKEYRGNGYFSRIVCYPNDIIGLKTFSVIYRAKLKK